MRDVSGSWSTRHPALGWWIAPVLAILAVVVPVDYHAWTQRDPAREGRVHIRVYPGATDLRDRDVGGVRMIDYDAPAAYPRQDILDFYKLSLAAREGWKPDPSAADGGGKWLGHLPFEEDWMYGYTWHNPAKGLWIDLSVIQAVPAKGGEKQHVSLSVSLHDYHQETFLERLALMGTAGTWIAAGLFVLGLAGGRGINIMADRLGSDGSSSRLRRAVVAGVSGVALVASLQAGGRYLTGPLLIYVACAALLVALVVELDGVPAPAKVYWVVGGAAALFDVGHIVTRGDSWMVDWFLPHVAGTTVLLPPCVVGAVVGAGAMLAIAALARVVTGKWRLLGDVKVAAAVGALVASVGYARTRPAEAIAALVMTGLVVGLVSLVRKGEPRRLPAMIAAVGIIAALGPGLLVLCGLDPMVWLDM